ncbi:MAG: CBS domain-containing protein [Candidatus Micrarchaeota archaeon]|nr:CBS domain-containing protein [Candidatus Micrarchaeota archaeon]MDE1804577.1 CBS domain-containing protein [Candidatus Micrarchaeota archaeon]MDE1846993.1 CBS domain-containing protein [Candidatus Micrarchaeota archaeon]
MPKAFETLPEEFVSQTKMCDYKTPLSTMMGKIKSHGSVIVMKGKEYYGLVDDRTIASKGAIKINEKFPAGKFAKKVPMLDEATSIEKAIHYFYNSGTKALPFTEGNKIKGVIKREMMLRAILSLHLLSNYNAGYAMSSPVVAIDKDSTVAQAKSAMESHKVNKIIALSGSKVYGILAYSDIIAGFAKLTGRATTEKERTVVNKISATKVGEVCQTNVYRIDHSRPIEEAIKSMIELDISSLLVTKSDKPVGILTVKDLFELVVSSATGVQERIFISGLDARTKEYEDEIRSELEALADRVDRFGRLKTDYISLNIRSPRAKNYEMKGRLSLAKGGTISSAAFGFSIEDTLKKLTDNIYNEVRRKKEIIVTGKRGDREEPE